MGQGSQEMKHSSREDGFTLVELMVVVLIVGILVALAVPIFWAAKATAQKRTCFANERTIEGAAQTYRAGTGNFPPATAIDSGNPLITGFYIKSPPTCPSVGVGSYYSMDGNGTAIPPTGCPHGHF